MDLMEEKKVYQLVRIATRPELMFLLVVNIKILAMNSQREREKNTSESMWLKI